MSRSLLLGCDVEIRVTKKAHCVMNFNVFSHAHIMNHSDFLITCEQLTVYCGFRLLQVASQQKWRERRSGDV